MSHNATYEFRKSRGEYLKYSQAKLPKTERNYGYVDYMRKSYESETLQDSKYNKLIFLRYQEASRDYFTGQITQINNLVQFDHRPSDLKEARWDIYKISLSFEDKGKDI